MNELSQPTVVKLGGSIFDACDSTITDLVQLQRDGYQLVVVHGGAKMVTSWCAAMNIESQFHQGERITDRRSLDVVTAVLTGLANKETVAAVMRAGGRAIGLSGADGGLIQARVKDLTLGYIGEVSDVNPQPLTILLAAGFIPIVSPVSYHYTAEAGEPLLLNVNGDTAAGKIACAIDAKKLIYLTDVAGIRGADGKIIARLNPAEARGLLTTGVALGGMIPKLNSCLVAASAGVTCYIADGRQPHALAEVISGTATGTIIYPETGSPHRT